MIHIGFTGTQRGLTSYQYDRLDELLDRGQFMIHHGDCIGADKEMHSIARNHGHLITLHPPSINTKRAFCDYDVIMMEKVYLVRNHDIVDDTFSLIACPGEIRPKRRSGTWATIRYAMKLSKRVTIIYPRPIV